MSPKPRLYAIQLPDGRLISLPATPGDHRLDLTTDPPTWTGPAGPIASELRAIADDIDGWRRNRHVQARQGGIGRYTAELRAIADDIDAGRWS